MIFGALKKSYLLAGWDGWIAIVRAIRAVNDIYTKDDRAVFSITVSSVDSELDFVFISIGQKQGQKTQPEYQNQVVATKINFLVLFLGPPSICIGLRIGCKMKKTTPESFKRGNSIIKQHLSKIDSTILEEMFKISTAALYHTETISRVGDTTGIDKARIAALIPVFSDLSQGSTPSIRKEQDIEMIIKNTRMIARKG